jgi:hypothetical protein
MKKTIKRKIAEFVSAKGTATRTEIVEFYVDLIYGEGTYKSGKSPNPMSIDLNPFRGCLSSGFNDIFEEYQKEHGGVVYKKAWLMNADTNEYLVRVSRGKYQAVIKN